jgi:hypothetical protein
MFKKYLGIVLVLSIYSCKNIEESINKIELIPVKIGNVYGFINHEGKIEINPQFANASIFHDGLALVQTNGQDKKWGYIEKDGKYKIQPVYKSATTFSDGLAWVVTENAAPVAIDIEGSIKFSLQEANEVKKFSEGLAAFSIISPADNLQNNKERVDSAAPTTDDYRGSNLSLNEEKTQWGFVDKTGQKIINPQFAAVNKFKEELCAVKTDNGKWGFIDQSGKFIINPQFDEISDFTDGLAIAKIGDKVGVIDKEGKYQINPQFSKIIQDGNIFLISLDGKWGWCDNQGKILINPQFQEAFPFNNSNLAPVSSGDVWGFISKEGKFEINPQFNGALSFIDDLAAVSFNGKIGFIDKKGKYVINPQFERFSEDYYCGVIQQYEFNSCIESDFFDVSLILKRINIKNPEGLQPCHTFGDLATKLKLDSFQCNSIFDVTYKDPTNWIKSNIVVAHDVSLDFGVRGDALKWVPDGWNTKLEFDRSGNISSFNYRINLVGKAEEKGDLIIQAFKNEYPDLEFSGSEGTFYFTNPKTRIIKFRMQFFARNCILVDIENL